MKKSELLERVKELETEVEEYNIIISHQSNLLRQTINLVRGNPPENVLWSFHDIVDRVKEAIKNEMKKERKMCIDKLKEWAEVESPCSSTLKSAAYYFEQLLEAESDLLK